MNLKKIMFKSLLVFSFLGTTFGGTVANANGNSSNSITQDSNLAQSSSANAYAKGTLQLNEVPSLSFRNTENPSVDNLNTDDNNKLIVTDYRDHPGWSLNAGITDLSPSSGTNSSYTPPHSGEWTMNLDTSNITNHESESNAPNTNNGSSSLDIDPGSSSTSDNNNNILSTTTNNSGYGVNEVDFNSHNKTTLNVPNVRSGNYGMTMNWNLSANANSGDTSN